MKINTNLIEGYATMSDAEKLQALESYEFDTSGLVDKKLFDKTSSELANYKKKYQETLSEEERKSQERQEELQRMKDELDSLRKDKQIADSTARFLSLGYADDLAKSTAQAYVNGDMDTVFANQKQHQESIEKKVKTDLMKGTPKPEVGNDSSTMTKEQLRKMTPQERFEFSQKNPDVYKSIYEQ
jgi:hypothetical protein